MYKNEWVQLRYKNLLSKKRDVIKKYYKSKQEINKEIHLKKKYKKREYGRNIYHSTPEEKKEKLKEYQKNYRQTKKLKEKILIVSFRCIKNGTRSCVFWRKWHH